MIRLKPVLLPWQNNSDSFIKKKTRNFPVHFYSPFSIVVRIETHNKNISNFWVSARTFYYRAVKMTVIFSDRCFFYDSVEKLRFFCLNSICKKVCATWWIYYEVARTKQRPRVKFVKFSFCLLMNQSVVRNLFI